MNLQGASCLDAQPMLWALEYSIASSYMLVLRSGQELLVSGELLATVAMRMNGYMINILIKFTW
eukprot:783688-Amphidinium_carterae.1